jgi:hypothetical protein
MKSRKCENAICKLQLRKAARKARKEKENEYKQNSRKPTTSRMLFVFEGQPTHPAELNQSSWLRSMESAGGIE